MPTNKVRSLLGDLDDIGETFYVVDADYRTAAQGWSNNERTGPLDLHEQRNIGRVFYTSGVSGNYNIYTTHATDVAAIQTAVDAMTDYRGDKLILTPGSYSIGTALALNVPGMRLVGPASRHPKAARSTVTATVDAALTVSEDDIEIAHLRLIPLTAANLIDVSSGADRGYLHHLFYDSAGVAASTSTEFLAAAASVDWLAEQCAFYVDAAQGDAFTLTSSQRWIIQDNEFYVGLTTIAWASVVTFVTSALGNVIRRNAFRGCGGATAAVFTNLLTGIANVNGQAMVYGNWIDGTALATATAIETTFGTTTDIELAENYQTGDATTEGGVLVTLA